MRWSWSNKQKGENDLAEKTISIKMSSILECPRHRKEAALSGALLIKEG